MITKHKKSFNIIVCIWAPSNLRIVSSVRFWICNCRHYATKNSSQDGRHSMKIVDSTSIMNVNLLLKPRLEFYSSNKNDVIALSYLKNYLEYRNKIELFTFWLNLPKLCQIPRQIKHRRENQQWERQMVARQDLHTHQSPHLRLMLHFEYVPINGLFYF